jgi:hypothetical protein
MNPGASPRFRWRTRGPVNLGAGLPLQVEQFEARWAGSSKMGSGARQGPIGFQRGLGLRFVAASQNAAAPNTAAATGASKATESTARPGEDCAEKHWGLLGHLFNMSLIAVAAYGFPVLVVWPASASAAETSRSRSPASK